MDGYTFNKVVRFILLLLLAVTLAKAEDIYVAQNALGGEMNSAATATNLDWFNTSANWGSGASKISSGDTVHFVGTFTNAGIARASGVDGSPITLKAESGAKWILSASVANVALHLDTFNYLIVDGGPDAWIEYTNNGTLLQVQALTFGIYSTPSIGNIEVRNWRITNIFVFDTGSAYITDYGSGVKVEGGIITNISVHNITVDWATRGVHLNYGGGVGSHDWQVYSNTLIRCNWGAGGGDGQGGSSLFNLYVHHNTIKWNYVWNSTGNPNYHENGTYFWAELGGGSTGSYISNSFYYANLIGPEIGTSTTGHIFTSAGGGKGIINCNIYNNVFIGTTSYGVLIQKGVDFRFFNNTSYSYPGGGGNVTCAIQLVTGTILTYNNVFYAIGSPLNISDAVRTAATPFASDYNSFFALNPFGGAWGDLAQHAYSTWVAMGYESHSITTNPLLVNTNTYDLHILTNSPAIAAGTNLNVLGYPGIGVDFDGVTRPVSSAWAIGAYEYVPPSVAVAAGALTIGSGITLGAGMTIR